MEKKNYPIVKYANELNNLDFSAFTLVDRRFFFSFLSQCKDKKEGSKIVLSRRDLLDLGVYPEKVHLTVNAFIRDLDRVTKKCYSLFFRSPIVTENNIIIRNIRIFDEIRYEFDRKDLKNLDKVKVSFRLHSEAIEFLERHFNFTTFPLPEFQELRRIYSQNLFLQLKQFRNTGEFYVSQEELRSLLNVPSNYRLQDIDKRALKPAIKELEKFFPNLKYKKLRNGPDKRKVSTYLFTWNPLHDRKDRAESYRILKDNPLPLWKEVDSFINQEGLSLSTNEAIAILAKRVQKETIHDWHQYLSGVDKNKRSSRKEPIKELPEWFTAEPSKSSNPILLLKAQMSIYELQEEDYKEHLEDLCKLTGLDKKTVLYYFDHPEILNQLIEELSNSFFQ